MGDVGRQGHLAQAVQNLLEYPIVGETDLAVTLVHDVDDFAGQEAAAKDNALADPRLFARLDERLPDVAGLAAQKQHLHGAAGPLSLTHEPRRDDLGVVDHQAVLRP